VSNRLQECSKNNVKLYQILNYLSMYHSRQRLTIRGYVHQWPSYTARTACWILPPIYIISTYSILGLQLLELNLAKVVPNLGTLPWADTCYLGKARVAVSKMQHIHSSSHPSEGGGGGICWDRCPITGLPCPSCLQTVLGPAAS
jgi:hypothetical protein